MPVRKSAQPKIPFELEVPVFRPTWQEFKHFSEYLKYVDEHGGGRIGLAKIIPPPEWVPRRSYRDFDAEIYQPIEQDVSGKDGLYQVLNSAKRSKNLSKFAQISRSTEHRPPSSNYHNRKDAESKYWKAIPVVKPIYGADTPGSCFDTDQKVWNIKLGLEGSILNELDGEVTGVTTSYLYFGMWKSTFAWHTEDKDLYSINYIHWGAGKSWYAIPPEFGSRLETMAKGFWPADFRICPEFMRHKSTLISPSIMHDYNIPWVETTQEAGEIMITFPRAYHAGFNRGLNCAESTNFALERWIDIGLKAKTCKCRKDTVRIEMDYFVRKYRPHLLPPDEDSTSDESLTDISEAELPQKPKGRKRGRPTLTDDRSDVEDAEDEEEEEDSESDIENDTEEDQAWMRIRAEKALSNYYRREREINRQLCQRVDKNRIHSNTNTSNPAPSSADNTPRSMTVCAICMLTDVYTYHVPISPEKDGDRSKNGQTSAEATTEEDETACGMILQMSEASDPAEMATKVVNETYHLIRCPKCEVVVHPDCYQWQAPVIASDEPTDVAQEWQCERCYISPRKARCTLCHEHGGALRATTVENSWVHVSCAQSMPELYEKLPANEPIDLTLVNRSRFNLKCAACLKSGDKRDALRGACVQCTYGKCKRAYHIPCTRKLYTVRDAYGAVLEVRCPKHHPSIVGPGNGRDDEAEATESKGDQPMSKKAKTEGSGALVSAPAQESFKIGDLVMAKWHNGAKYPARIIDIKEKKSIIFEITKRRKTREARKPVAFIRCNLTNADRLRDPLVGDLVEMANGDKVTVISVPQYSSYVVRYDGDDKIGACREEDLWLQADAEDGHKHKLVA